MDEGYATKYLEKIVNVVVDRPAGSLHPNHRFRYPLNYGYVNGVVAPDGEFLDAYVLGTNSPLHYFQGICIAVLRRKEELDDKLIIVDPTKSYSNKEIMEAVYFQEQFFTIQIIRH